MRNKDIGTVKNYKRRYHTKDHLYGLVKVDCPGLLHACFDHPGREELLVTLLFHCYLAKILLKNPTLQSHDRQIHAVHKAKNTTTRKEHTGLY